MKGAQVVFLSQRALWCVREMQNATEATFKERVSMCRCAQMSRFLDLTEFGEAAQYLRLTNLEQLAARAQAFDGIYSTLVFPPLYTAYMSVYMY